VKSNVPVAEATVDEVVLPERVQQALGQLLGAVQLETYEHFADRDPLGDVVLERMLAGVSTRQYRRAQEPVGEQVEDDARSTSKSAVSRMFVDRTREQLWRLMNRPLSDLRLAAIMLDGIDLHGSTNVVALGITTAGDKLALGLWEGSTETAAVASALLADLVDRGLDIEQGLLFVIDGCQSPAQGDPPGVRPRGPGPALCAAQGT
jgi:putative transposase